MRMEKQKSDCTTYEKFKLGLQIIDFLYIDRVIHILSKYKTKMCSCCYYYLLFFRVAAMESISNAITNGQTNGVVVSGPVGSVPANVVTAGGGVAQGKRVFICLLR